jgi:hypothetical protein
MKTRPAALSPRQAGAPCQIGDVHPQIVWAGRNVAIFAKPSLHRRKFLRGGAHGLDRLRPTMGKIAEGHHASVAMEVVDRRVDFTDLLISAKRGPARMVPLHHEALPGDEPLVNHRQPGASGLSAAAKTMRIGWERHGQSSFLAGYFHNYGVKTGAAAVGSTVVQYLNSNA